MSEINLSKIPTFHLELERVNFPDEETYQKALASTQEREFEVKDNEVDISGLDKAEVLFALYSAGRPRGMGFLQERNDLTIEEVREWFKEGQTYFDYVAGRPIKVSLADDVLNTRLYNRDNGGDGSAERIIEQLREGNK